MNRYRLLLAASLLIGAVSPASAARSLGDLAQQAISADPAVSSKAIAALRSTGPGGLDALWTAYAADLRSPARSGDSRRARIDLAIDTVGQQRDDWAARLYWYTDLEQAKAAARKAGKPILSLRLLGRLSDELSCANSRFFRTALYPNADVSRYLRENYILHWTSERPAPRITIDYGDGRKIVRTVTGNSIHYILDSDGRPIDALPGLYGPRAFLLALRRGSDWTKQLADAPDRDQRLRELHQTELDQIALGWRNDTETLRREGLIAPSLTTLITALPKPPADAQSPTALAAAPIAMSKMAIELPVVRSLSPDGGAAAVVPEDTLWQRLGKMHAADAVLDASSRAVMAEKYPGDPSLGRMAASFEESMARDTARNEYLLHYEIHTWFVRGPGVSSLASLNQRVYAELFLTPRTDPWLGLAANDAYSALPNGGIAEPASIARQQARASSR
jgi:hypothetical protein